MFRSRVSYPAERSLVAGFGVRTNLSHLSLFSRAGRVSTPTCSTCGSKSQWRLRLYAPLRMTVPARTLASAHLIECNKWRKMGLTARNTSGLLDGVLKGGFLARLGDQFELADRFFAE
jgi:hypothetical protein